MERTAHTTHTGQQRFGIRQILGVVILLSLLTVITVSVIGSLWNHPVAVNEAAPNITLPSLNGGSVSLSAYRGKIVVLNVFTTWCGPCVDEAPVLASFVDQHGKDAQLIMVDRQEAAPTVRTFIDSHGLHQAVVALDVHDQLAKPYGVTGQPETFYITQQGIVVKHVIGPTTLADMEAQLLLMKSSSTSP